MEIFCEVDRKDGGKTAPISSTYPAYCFREQIDQLEEETESLKRRIEMGAIEPQYLPAHKEELRIKQEKLDKIYQAKPKLSSKDIDKLARFQKEIGEEISRIMPSYTEMQRGTASPQDEVRKMHREGCVSIEGHKQLFSDMGIKPRRNGKVTRNDAAKAWKIARSLLGEPTNVETLRRDHVGHSYTAERSLAQMEREG